MFLCRKSVFDGWKKWLFFGFWFIWNESLKSPEKNVVIEQKNFPITQFGGLFLSILLSYGHFSASLFLWWSWGFWLKIPVAFKDHNTKVMNKTSKYWEYRVGVSISWTHCCSTCIDLPQMVKKWMGSYNKFPINYCVQVFIFCTCIRMLFLISNANPF